MRSPRDVPRPCTASTIGPGWSDRNRVRPAYCRGGFRPENPVEPAPRGVPTARCKAIAHPPSGGPPAAPRRRDPLFASRKRNATSSGRSRNNNSGLPFDGMAALHRFRAPLAAPSPPRPIFNHRRRLCTFPLDYPLRIRHAGFCAARGAAKPGVAPAAGFAPRIAIAFPSSVRPPGSRAIAA